MMPRLAEILLRKAITLSLVLACGSAWTAGCIQTGQGANAGGTGIGGTGTMAKGTGIGGTGIQLGVVRNESRLAGRVISSQGEIQAELNGAARALASGDTVCVGDKITTSASASVKLRMADGMVVTLRPQTLLKIEKFTYGGTAKDASVLALDKGACRIVTGNIGKQNPDNDQLQTPNATIGIRDADHETAVILPGNDKGYPAGTYDKVNHGATFIGTIQGDITIHPEQAGYSASKRSQPILLQDIPGLFSGDADQ